MQPLSARDVRRLMRRHGATIRSVAARMGITMKRVREVCRSGLRPGTPRAAYHDWCCWCAGITGIDPFRRRVYDALPG